MNSLNKLATKITSKLKKSNLFRSLNETNRIDGVHVNRDGKNLISFSCNDYLGLSHHPKVKQAAIDAIEKYGTGAGASRYITGNHLLYKDIESRLADIKGTEDAIVFGSGYLANTGVIPTIVGKGDLVLSDRFIHASLVDGIALSGAKMLRFTHNDVEKCRNILRQNRHKYRNCLIVTDNVFSMDGDIAPVNELYTIAEESGAWLMTDDAHGFGVLDNKVYSAHIQSGTLSKAIGGYGGYVCTSLKLADYLRNKVRPLIYSTGLPPSVIATAIAALDVIKNDTSLRHKSLENAKLFTKILGMEDAESAIVAVILGDEKRAVEASKALEDKGFLVSAIRPPTVPKGTARLRFTFSSLHKREDVEKMAEVVKDIVGL